MSQSPENVVAASSKADIGINFQADTQSVTVELDPEKMKTFEFALAVLDMAKMHIETIKRQVQAQNMQQQAMAQMHQAQAAQQQAHTLGRALKLGR